MDVLKNIAIRDGYEIRYLIREFSGLLKKKYNTKIYVYGSDSSKIFYNEYLKDKIIEEYITCDDLHEKLFCRIDDVENLFKRSLKIEKFLGHSFNLLRMTRRDLGLGFYSGARYHPKSPSSNKANYLQTVNAYTSLLEFWISELKNKKITLFLNGLKDEELVCKALKIPYRILSGSRVQNYWHWALSLRTEFPQVRYFYKKLKNKSFNALNLSEQYYQDTINKKLIFSKSPLRNFIEKSLFQTLKEIYNFKKRITVRRYYYFSYLNYLLNEYRHTKLLQSKFVDQIDVIKNKKFIYFPLHTEPEMSLHWMSPECFNQIDVIMSLSRDLPSDTYLVVKETIYAVGKRDKYFYEQIKNLKNTILLDVNSDSLKIIRDCSAVAIISGTAGVEAASQGKPVLIFAKYSFYDFLSHVFKVNTNENNYNLIKKITDKNFVNKKTKANGARLEQAIIDASFNMKDFTNLHREKFDDEILLRLDKGLISSFRNI
jgi:hypothetical protein